MSTPATHPAALANAQQLFAQQGLPFPALPQTLASALQEHSPTLFGTQALDASPTTWGQLRSGGAGHPATPDSLVLGIDGHGTNSWALHYFVTLGPLALFIAAWGGAYMEADQARDKIRRVFAWADTLTQRVQRLQQAGPRLIRERLVVVIDPMPHPCWVQLPWPAAGAVQISGTKAPRCAPLWMPYSPSGSTGLPPLPQNPQRRPYQQSFENPL